MDAKELPPGMPPAREAAESVDEERWGVSGAVTAILEARDGAWRQRIAEVEAERDALKTAVEGLSEPRVLDMQIRDGRFDALIDGRGLGAIMADAYWKLLDTEGATNYVELRLGRGGKEMIVTVQKLTGKSPATLKQEAENQHDALRAQLAAVETRLREAEGEVFRWREVWITGRAAWQCSGCREVFFGRHRETCPTCKRVGYWCGSINPAALDAAIKREHERLASRTTNTEGT